MQVGQLIDALEPHRGRGDSVYVRAIVQTAVDTDDWANLPVTEVRYDAENCCVVIEVDYF